MLNALALPLMFSMLAGVYAYVRFPERRSKVLLVVILFQLVGAGGYVTEPGHALFGLLSMHALVVFTLLLHGLGLPIGLATERVRGK